MQWLYYVFFSVNTINDSKNMGQVLIILIEAFRGDYRGGNNERGYTARPPFTRIVRVA
jgi:hypothetical protein